MKKTLAAGLLAIALAPGVALAKNASTTFSVKGWHCGGCSSKTEAALKKVKGVQTVASDSDKGTVSVAYDDGVTNEKALQAAIKDSGYEAAVQKAPANQKN